MQAQPAKVSPPRTGAVPHPLPLTPPIDRVGGLAWWIFRNCDTAPEDLIEAANEAGFPTVFLPLPFPVAPTVAFRRGLDRACATSPGQPREWQYDLVLRPARGSTDKEIELAIERLKKTYRVDEKIEARIRSYPGEAAMAVVERWEPALERPRRPWHVHLWVVMRCDDAAVNLPVDDVLLVVQVVTGGDADEMEGRIREKVGKMRTRAAASEIGDGVMDALSDVGGVKLRPGLFSVPGELGILRGEETLQFLQAVGDTEAGMYDLYEEAGGEGAGGPGLMPAVLREEIAELHGQIHGLEVDRVGVGALRTRWYEIENLKQKLCLNESFLGAEFGDLSAELADVRRTLVNKAEQVGQRLEREVVLMPPPDQNALGRLWAGLGLMTEVVTAEVVHADDLEAASAELLAGQKAVREIRLRLLLRRLRKLAAATAHVLEDRAQVSARRQELFIEALAAAVAYVKAQLPAPDSSEAVLAS